MIREFHQISLRGRNSFGVDQRAARLVEFETAEDLRTFFAAGIPGRWTVLAGGNNILFTEDYDGVLLTPVARDEHDFSQGSIPRNIMSLALPMTAAQLINVLYSVVDRSIWAACRGIWP